MITIKDLKKIPGLIIKKNEPMNKYTTYGIGGEAKFFVIPQSKQSLLDLISYLNKNKLKYFILGSGSNLLVNDKGFDGVVVSIKRSLETIKIENSKLYVECGAMLGTIVKECIKNNLSGIENLVGVPGTLGGALVMNAGAWGGEISDKLQSVEIIDNQNELKILQRKDIDFSYRLSSFNSNEVLISATFNLEKKDKEQIEKKYQLAREGRKSSQPTNVRSAGSVFKNPPGNSAGKLIELCGLKGYRIGGAIISEKHANFFINEKDSSASDMMHLIRYAQKEVFKKFNIKLETEIKFLGFE